MLMKLLRTMSLLTLILVLTPACAQQDDGTDTKDSAGSTAQTVESLPAGETKQATDTPASDMSIMDQPVDFSTPEDVEKTIAAVKANAGEAAARNLNNAMKYILMYDLSLSMNKEKMYQKLNGSTPNEIIAQVKRY